MQDQSKTCKNCGYWINERPHPTWPIDNPTVKLIYGNCNHRKLAYECEAGKVESDDWLLYDDYEAYKAFLKVGANFGCIHWEQREKNSTEESENEH